MPEPNLGKTSSTQHIRTNVSYSSIFREIFCSSKLLQIHCADFASDSWRQVKDGTELSIIMIRTWSLARWIHWTCQYSLKWSRAMSRHYLVQSYNKPLQKQIIELYTLKCVLWNKDSNGYVALCSKCKVIITIVLIII